MAERPGGDFRPPNPSSRTGPADGRFGIYVHCPYCRTKCPYCDFNVAIHREPVAPFVADAPEPVQRYAALPWAGRDSRAGACSSAAARPR